MAAKLILSMNGVVLQEHVLDKEHMTIGRKPHNDIVIDNLAVSGEHAAIVTIFNDSFLEDLNSTNGTLVNGAPIKNHFLQNSDVIEIGKYKLKYLNDQKIQSAVADFEKTMVFRASSRIAAATPVNADSSASETTLKLNPTELQQLSLAEKVPEMRTGAVTSSQPSLVIPVKKVVADSATASDGETESQPAHANSADKVVADSATASDGETISQPAHATSAEKVVAVSATASDGETVSQPALATSAEKAVADSAAASDGEAVSQPARVSSAEKVPGSQQVMGVIQIFTGPNAGKELELVKNLTTVGKSGLQVVVFTRRPRGYFITYVEGESYPNLNGKPMDDQPCQLKEHDIIELAGIKMEFYLKS